MSAGDGSGFSEDSLLARLAEAPALSPPAPLPRPGDRLGRFEIVERLGRGATGVVFAARDVVLKREVALKLLAAGAVEPGARARVLAEARAAARIVHPAVAAVHDVLELDGSLVLVLERVEGETLRRRLRRCGPLAERRAAALVAEAARAAAAAHRAGIVHRDLKPENIMVSAHERVKLLDFGLAAALGGRSAQRAAGTRGYQAPEVATLGASAASDQFSLAVVMVEAVSGTRPGGASSVPRGLSPRLRRVVVRALAERPEQRFASCDELALRLERVATGGSLTRVGALLGLLAVGLASSAQPATSEPGHGAMNAATAASVTSASPPPRVACPPLAVSSAGRGWLGAAAANVACRQARAMLGGGRSRALPPAALLDLPATPAEDYPRDPFGEEGARERALAAALRSDRVVIDGSLQPERGGFRVRLSARWADSVLAEGESQGTLAAATTEATRQLFAGPALLPAQSSDDEAAQQDGEASVDALARIAFAEAAGATGGSLAAARAGLAGLIDLHPRAATLALRLAAGAGEKLVLDPPSLEPGSALALSRAATAHVLLGGGTPALELADRVAAVRDGRPVGPVTSKLLRVESVLRLAGGQREQARALALAAALDDPWDAPWGVLAHTSFGRPEFATLSRAYRAWAPETADAWNIAAHVDADEAQRLELLEHAYVLGDGFPLYAGNYGAWLLINRRPDEARLVHARLELGTPGQRIAASKLGVELALSEGRVLGAFELAREALSGLPSVGSIETGDVALLALYVELGVLLGQGEQAASHVLERFVRPEPPLLDRGPFARAAIAHVCAYAAREVAARCFERLEQLTAAGHFPLGGTGDAEAFVEGARAFAALDQHGAERAFRRVQADLGGRSSVAALALERAGDLERADALDPARPGVLGGASLSQARAARRALARGDCGRALPWAQGVERALRKADADIALVPEMRAIIRRCCRAASGCALP